MDWFSIIGDVTISIFSDFDLNSKKWCPSPGTFFEQKEKEMFFLHLYMYMEIHI